MVLKFAPGTKFSFRGPFGTSWELLHNFLCIFGRNLHFFLCKTGKTVFGEQQHCIINGITFEVGGKNKNGSQIKDTRIGYLVKDNIEYAFGKSIPIWMFGFLY